MWFKNLQIYRLPANWNMSAERLEEQLAKKPFHPCGSQDMESRGFDGRDLLSTARALIEKHTKTTKT